MKKSAAVSKAPLAANDASRLDAGLHERLFMQLLEQKPGMVLEIIDGLIAAGELDEPNEAGIERDLRLLARGLETIRYGVERKNKTELKLASDIRKRLLQAHIADDIRPEILLLILNQFSAAKLEIGDELRAAARATMDDFASDAEAEGHEAAGLAAMFAELGDRPFDIHATLGGLADAMPVESQVQLAAALFGESEPVANAALGFLQSQEPVVRKAASEVLAEIGAESKVAGAVGLRRLIALRDWRPEAERAAFDAAIKAIRAIGVTPAPWPTAAPSKASKIKVHVSGFDGSGMQGIFVIVPDGKQFKIASVIARLGMGVRDAYVRDEMSKADVDDMLGMASGELTLTTASLDYVATVIRQCLVSNVATGLMPPFGLLDFAECAGLSDLTPSARPADAIVAELISAIDPERLTPSAVAAVLADSSTWHIEYAFLESWFEDGEDLKAQIGRKGAAAKKTEFLFASRLERNRRRWAEVLTWAALTAKQQKNAPEWQDFAILARELLSSRPLAEIGLMHHIARNTIDTMSAQNSGLVFLG